MKRSKTSVALITMLAFLTIDCGTKKAVTKLDLQAEDITREQLKNWQYECTKGETESTCPNKTLSFVYHSNIDLKHDNVLLKKELEYKDREWQNVVDLKDYELAGVKCMWWLWMLIGAAAAAATTTGIILGK